MSSRMISYRNRARGAGFTLTELVISLLIGLIILSAVIGLFVSMIKSDNDNLKSIRLHQEMRAAMSLITRDMRRAGANPAAAALPNLWLGGGVVGTASATGSCLMYSYDTNTTFYGFRWNNNNLTIEAYNGTSVGDCALTNSTGWTPLTDSDLIEVTDGASTPKGLEVTVSQVFEGTFKIREITVRLWSRLKRDHAVMHSMSETIRIRNDEVAPTPTPIPTPGP